MRINEYISVQDNNVEIDKQEEGEQIQRSKAALRSIKLKTKQIRVLSKKALNQIKMTRQDNRKNNV